MQITDILECHGKKKKVFIDDTFAFPLYGSEIRKYKLEIGMTIDEATYEELRLVVKKRMQERILYLLGDTDKSEHDIRSKMLRSGNPEDLLDQVIEQLKEYRYIDDRRFATGYAESLRDNRGKSKRAILTSLYTKGIPKDVLEELVEEFEFDDEAQLYKALQKKRVTPESILAMDQKEKMKLYASLMRKGFSYEALNKVIKGGFE